MRANQGQRALRSGMATAFSDNAESRPLKLRQGFACVELRQGFARVQLQQVPDGIKLRQAVRPGLGEKEVREAGDRSAQRHRAPPGSTAGGHGNGEDDNGGD